MYKEPRCIWIFGWGMIIIGILILILTDPSPQYYAEEGRNPFITFFSLTLMGSGVLFLLANKLEAYLCLKLEKRGKNFTCYIMDRGFRVGLYSLIVGILCAITGLFNNIEIMFIISTLSIVLGFIGQVVFTLVSFCIYSLDQINNQEEEK